jgi:hypothetical protein
MDTVWFGLVWLSCFDVLILRHGWQFNALIEAKELSTSPANVDVTKVADRGHAKQLVVPCNSGAL